jgi:hypothetical protein
VEKTLNETSEIGKTSIYNSPAGPTDQEVMSLSLDNVTNIIGEYVVCLFKDIEHTKKSLVSKEDTLDSMIEKTDVNDSPVNKVVVHITEIDKIRIVKAFINQINTLNSRLGKVLITNSSLEKRYDNGSLVSQSLIIKSQIKKEALDG